MSTSTTTTTFTRTHAKHLGAKVIADLYQCSVLYGYPATDSMIAYETELVEMLTQRYVATYEFGFESGGKRMLTWYYRVGTDGALSGDVNAGGIYAKATVAAWKYFNFMTYTDKWWSLTDAQRVQFKNGLPFQRNAGLSPQRTAVRDIGKPTTATPPAVSESSGGHSGRGEHGGTLR